MSEKSFSLMSEKSFSQGKSKEHPQNLVQGTLASLQEHFLCVHRPSIALHWHLINFSSSSGARTGEVSWNLGSIIPLMSSLYHPKSSADS